MERFLQCTSHDLRTPVQAVSLVATMLPDVLPDADEDDEQHASIQELMDVLTSSVFMLDVILSNVLNLQKLSSNDMELSLEPGALLVERVQQMVKVIEVSTSSKKV